MKLFKTFLIVELLMLTAFTVLVVQQHGLDLITPFFGEMLRFSWSGQFNLDFLLLLTLAGLWVAWRHEFSGKGLLLGFLTTIGGFMVLAPYLLLALAKSGGRVDRLLLGERMA